MFNKILTGLALLLTGISLGAYWFFAGQLGISTNGSDWANFGSYVGGIFSGLAFLILIYQNYQREIEQKQQSENQRKQDFERTFFMMLEHHNNKLRFLEDKNSGVEEKEGKLSFVDYIYQVITKNQRDFSSIRKVMSESLYREYSELNSYFLNLFRIIKFIYENKNFNENNEYSSLLRSFISKKMLTILAYHL
ncbi:TPA: putative phage abortive infection protein, partial [Mannheimia haemolytica]